LFDRWRSMEKVERGGAWQHPVDQRLAQARPVAPTSASGHHAVNSSLTLMAPFVWGLYK
jgi:hypothetical protein